MFGSELEPCSDEWGRRLSQDCLLDGSPTTLWEDDTRAVLIDGFVLDRGFAPIRFSPSYCIDDAYNGNFVMAELDKISRRLIVRSDALETRNAFYAVSGKSALISNDLNLMLARLGGAEIDDQSVYDYLARGHINTGRHTFFKEIHKLKAGEELIIQASPGGIRENLKFYIVLDFTESAMTRDEALGQIKEHLIKCMQGGTAAFSRPLISLSSGIDSNLINQLYQRHVTETDTLTHAFGHPQYDEYAALAAKVSLHRRAHCIRSYEDSMTRLSDIVVALGQPFNGLPTIGVFRISQFARDFGIKALISGVGDSLWYSVTRPKMQEIRASANRVFAADGTILPADSYLGEEFSRTHQGTASRLFEFPTAPSSEMKLHLLEQQFTLNGARVTFDNYVAGACYGVEHIQPYLQRSNLELVLALKDDILHFNDRPKSLVTELLEDLLGEPFVPGLKMTSPQREWLKTVFGPAMLDLIHDSSLASDGIVNSRKLAEAFDTYRRSPELSNSYFAWKFLVTEIWYRYYRHNDRIDLYPTYEAH